jgi:hypothetical protein
LELDWGRSGKPRTEWGARGRGRFEIVRISVGPGDAHVWDRLPPARRRVQVGLGRPVVVVGGALVLQGPVDSCSVDRAKLIVDFLK